MGKELFTGLVSVIVPCYNGASYLQRFLSAVCIQTYRKIQLIFVNDGSIDETENIFYSFRDEFRKNGIDYIYLFQKNQGQAAAVNKALQYISGEYLMWLDADDYITDDHIERKVDCLKKNPEYDIVRCQGVIVNETDRNRIIGKLGNKIGAGTLFEDLLLEIRECADGLYMVRTEAFLRALPMEKIYPSRAGQNFQLLLPVTYLYKVFYIEDPLFCYVERKESHSHGFKSIGDWKKRLDEINDVKLNVLNEMKYLFSSGYLEFVKSQLEILDLFYRINRILDYDYDIREDEYIKNTMIKLHQCMFRRNKEQKYWIWGLCDKNKRLASYFYKYLGISIEGFIDSDIQKQKNNGALEPEKIDGSKMYIIIFLEHHQDIADMLSLHGLKENENFIYPKNEIINNLKHRNIIQNK